MLVRNFRRVTYISTDLCYHVVGCSRWSSWREIFAPYIFKEIRTNWEFRVNLMHQSVSLQCVLLDWPERNGVETGCHRQNPTCRKRVVREPKKPKNCCRPTVFKGWELCSQRCYGDDPHMYQNWFFLGIWICNSNSLEFFLEGSLVQR